MTNTKYTLKGTYTALVTPFKNNGEVDYNAIEKLLNLQIDAKVQGVVILGTTGENPTLDAYEKQKIVAFAEKIVSGKIDIIIAISSNNTEKAINEIQGFSSSSAVAFLVGSPYYNKPTEKGILLHYTKIANASYKPIILYNVPSRTATNIPLSVIEKLSKHPNIIGIKEASGNLDYITKLMQYRSNHFSVLSGNDNQTLVIMALGGKGAISVVSNILPHEFDLMCQYALNHKFTSALIIHDLLQDIMNACFLETNPIPVKYILSKIHLIKNKLREPLTSLSAKNRRIINKILQNYFHY